MNPACQRLLFLFALLLLLSQCEKNRRDEFVPIHDVYFLEALIEQGVDKNNDGRISVPEAESTLSLKLAPGKVSELSGLEAFTELESLEIRMNPLAGLDVTANKVLEYLECTGCQLAVLDVSFNPKLRYLDCSGGAALSNRLTDLDLSKNPALEFLDCAENRINTLDLSKNNRLTTLICGRNQIKSLQVSANPDLIQLLVNNNGLTSLDVSNNLDLEKLITCGNQLGKLDISQHTKLTLIGVDNMPALAEVCVWTSPFPPEGVVVLHEFSPNVFFTTNCSF
jgi:Leucine-rich repeat (LRR) protein